MVCVTAAVSGDRERRREGTNIDGGLSQMRFRCQIELSQAKIKERATKNLNGDLKRI